MKYTEDELYLRVNLLINQLKAIAGKNSNIELYAYLSNISRSVKQDDIEWVIKTEKYILSPKFLKQRAFRDIDKESMIQIIRDYKLKVIL